ncbi:hypothetical protein AAC387_Pa07g2980 [Persea americana]
MKGKKNGRPLASAVARTARPPSGTKIIVAFLQDKRQAPLPDTARNREQLRHGPRSSVTCSSPPQTTSLNASELEGGMGVASHTSPSLLYSLYTEDAIGLLRVK